MNFVEVRHKLRQVISNGNPERISPNTKCDIWIISLAWCDLKGDAKETFEWELENDYQILRAIQRLKP